MGLAYREHLTRDPAIRSGKVIVRGTRSAVADILGYMAGGDSVETILEEIPQLTGKMFWPVLRMRLTKNLRLQLLNKCLSSMKTCRYHWQDIYSIADLLLDTLQSLSFRGRQMKLSGNQQRMRIGR